MSAPVPSLGPAACRPSHGADALEADARLAASRTFHGLDALRGIAAATVVLYHAAFVYGLGRPPEGFLAVDLFFAMSGFVIAHRYDADLAAGMGLRRFATLRLLRLYPLFLLGTLLGALPSVLMLLQGRSPQHAAFLSALPSAVLMLPSRAALPFVQELYPLNFVCWSLGLELLANLAYAALFRRLGVPALALVALAGLLGLCGCAFGWHTLEVGFEWPHAAGGFARIAFGFSAGVLLRRLTLRAPGGAALTLPRVPWPVAPVVALALFATPPLFGWAAGGLGAALWSLAGCTVVVPLILVAAVAGEPPRRLHRACALAGLYSYGLYSLHIPLLGLLLRVETRLHLDLGRQGVGGALAFTLLCAFGCLAAHRFYDKPLRRRLSQRLAAPARRRAVRSQILRQGS